MAAAYFLEKYAAEAGIGISIHLMEAQGRLGGVILTERVDDFLLEGGPDSFLSLKPAALELCRELGLSDHIVPSNDHLRKTYVLWGGRLRELPDGLMFVVPSKVWPIFGSDLFSFAGKLRLAATPFLPQPRSDGQDISVADFLRQRLGNQVVERLAEPLLAAVYGADVDSLSARTVLPQLIALEEKHGSLWRGIQAARRAARGNGKAQPKSSLFLTLRNGVGEIITSLEKKLVKTQVRMGTEITGANAKPEGSGFSIESRGGPTDAAAVIVATPAHAAARILRGLDSQLAEHLGAIRYHSSVTVSLGFAEGAFQPELQGFGFVVPRSEKKNLIACTWVSTKFPFRSRPEHVLLRCFLGGARDPAILAEEDSRIVEITLRELGEVMGSRPEPTFSRIYRWEKCMPQYRVGHLRGLEEISSRLAHHPGLFLAGNGYRGLGIPDCIQSASTAAAAALRYLQSL